MTCYVKTNYFHFVKIDNYNNKSNINVNMELGNGGESEKNFNNIFCSK
jgi:hypothetical protein